MKKLYEELSDFLLQKVQEHSLNLTNRSHQIPREDQVFSVSKANIKLYSSAIFYCQTNSRKPSKYTVYSRYLKFQGTGQNMSSYQ